MFKNPTIDFNILFNPLGNSTCSSPEVVLAFLLYEGSTIHNAIDQFVSCVYFLFVDFAFHPSPQTKNLICRRQLQKLYLHTNWKLDTCLYELTRNSPYYQLLKHFLFLLKHSVYLHSPLWLHLVDMDCCNTRYKVLDNRTVWQDAISSVPDFLYSVTFLLRGERSCIRRAQYGDWNRKEWFWLRNKNGACWQDYRSSMSHLLHFIFKHAPYIGHGKRVFCVLCGESYTAAYCDALCY